MSKQLLSQSIIVKDVAEVASKLKEASRGINFGEQVKLIREQLGMSQRTLALRSNTPQPTISKVENGEINVGISILKRILHALSGELIMVPMLEDSIEEIRRKRAREKAVKEVSYLKGTMGLEDHGPDSEFIEKLIQQEADKLLHGPNYKLWDD